MNEQNACPVCGTHALIYADHTLNSVFYECPICGRFQITLEEHTITKNNQLAPYLYHNRFIHNSFVEYRYHTTLNKEECDKYKKRYQNGDSSLGLPVHMDSGMIKTWYPKSFSERVDKIMLKLGTLSNHVGQGISFDSNELFSLLFIDRLEKDSLTDKMMQRDYSVCMEEAAYMLNCLSSAKLIEYATPGTTSIGRKITAPEVMQGLVTITPQGYSRIDTLQKNTAHGRNALVAMKFGDDTKPLRETIRTGIRSAGYNAVFIDEVQHNDFITPELLKYIRDSKFVVVDLTHQNNGAYFEEGYAMGLGKPVIQLCKKDTKLHFDIAQKNTIMWATEEDIPQMLSNRIKATID